MLATLAKTGNVSASARAADIDRTTHYRWFHSDAEYARAVQIAMDDAVDVLEAVAREGAILGSDTLLIFLLKGHRPEKYRDRHEVKHAGRVTIEERGDPFEILRDPEVRRVLDDYTARKYMKGQDRWDALPLPRS